MDDLVERDAEFASRILDCRNEDSEIGHRMADSILCELLRKLGCTATVEAFEDLTKWYA